MKPRILIEENFVLTKEVFEDFYSNAKKKGVFAVITEKGSAELYMGIYRLNEIPDFRKSEYDIKRILWGLIHKYGRFNYTPRRFEESKKYFEYEPETKTWSIYNK